MGRANKGWKYEPVYETRCFLTLFVFIILFLAKLEENITFWGIYSVTVD